MIQESRTLARGWGRPYHLVERVYRCPSRFSSHAFARDLAQALAPRGFVLLRSEHRQITAGRLTTLDLGYRRHRLYRLVLQQPEAALGAAVGAAPPGRLPVGHGKVAIVLDDWGYNRRHVSHVLQLNRPVTLAVLPHRRYSTAIAEAVRGSRCEVILHLPMEPHGAGSPREPHVLAPGMPPEMVRQMLDQALATVPYSRGVSSHQGSKATEDAALIRALLSELRRRRLVFLDSLVTDRSVCHEVARQVGVPFAQRSVFLDNEDTPEAVRRQFFQLAEVALQTGRAVGIGHDRRVTIEVLQELMSQLERQGIEFVRLSELAQPP